MSNFTDQFRISIFPSVGIDENAVGLNIWQTGQKRKRRKKDRADDPSDIEGWKGPWARFKDEKTNEELAATGEIRAEMDEILEKRRAKKALRRANRDEEEVSNIEKQIQMLNFLS